MRTFGVPTCGDRVPGDYISPHIRSLLLRSESKSPHIYLTEEYLKFLNPI